MDIIEYLRAKMIRTAEIHNSFTNPEVVAISQQLDRFLLQVQRDRSIVRTFVNSKVSVEERRAIKIAKRHTLRRFLHSHSLHGDIDYRASRHV